MIYPIDQYINSTPTTVVRSVHEAVLQIANLCTHVDHRIILSEENVPQVDMAISLRNVFAVFQVNGAYRQHFEGEVKSEWIFNHLSNGVKQSRHLTSEDFDKLLEQPQNEFLKQAVTVIVGGDISRAEVSLWKFGRRKSTLYVAGLRSKADPKILTVFAFTGSRRSSRIALFDDLLSMSLELAGASEHLGGCLGQLEILPPLPTLPIEPPIEESPVMIHTSDSITINGDVQIGGPSKKEKKEKKGKKAVLIAGDSGI